MHKHVVIAGGGIAGLSAATYLAEAGFQVTLCESKLELGGKAKSIRLPDRNPTEHSLRGFSNDYQTLLSLLSRIPGDDGRALLENLVCIHPLRLLEGAILGEQAELAPVRRTSRKGFFRRFLGALRTTVRVLRRGTQMIIGLRRRGVPVSETIAYLYAHIRLLWMCKERIQYELGDISYAEYLGFDQLSPVAVHFFSSLPRVIVAARANAEAAAIANLTLRMLFHFDRSPAGLEDANLTMAMMLNGPTSERLIEPWAMHLRTLGVDIQLACELVDADFAEGRITAVKLKDGRRVKCDYCVLAVPYLMLKRLSERSEIGNYIPHLRRKHQISLEASNGMQLFLKGLPEPCPPQFRAGAGTSHLDSEWSFVTVVQGEGFWNDIPLPAGTKYVLSATWSSGEIPGRGTGKTVAQCTPEELLSECLAQCGMERRFVIGWQIDQELRHICDEEYQKIRDDLSPHLAGEPYNGVRLLNFSPLTILLPGARHNSPRLRTEVPNLFLAGEAIYSPDLTLQIPTMEKAASSGYLVARAIAQGYAPALAEAMKLPEFDPLPLPILRHIDKWFWDRAPHGD